VSSLGGGTPFTPEQATTTFVATTATEYNRERRIKTKKEKPFEDLKNDNPMEGSALGQTQKDGQPEGYRDKKDKKIMGRPPD